MTQELQVNISSEEQLDFSAMALVDAAVENCDCDCDCDAGDIDNY